MKGTQTDLIFMDRNIHIYLPPSYHLGRERYPVVYVQDEGYLFRGQLSNLEEMFDRGEMRELIFVGVKPRNRNNEYTPWRARALSDPCEEFGGEGACYLSFLVSELKAYIDEAYRTLSDRNHTGIAGASFGGLISMYAAYLHPEAFGRVASVSGSFWYEGFIDFMRSTDIVHAGSKIYMDVGMLEGVKKDTIQRHMVARNKEAYEILLQKGFAPERCRLVIEEAAVHEHYFFIRRFPAALQWLFPPSQQQKLC